MQVTKSQSKSGSYQVTVTIFEARHLIQNGSPMVVVKVGNQKKRTAVRERTDNPFFNEFFVFDLTCSFDAFLSTKIIISIYLRGCLRRIKFYASIVFEVATVWDQPDHEYYHKWAMLTNPKDPSGGAKGYVKCNIVVQAKGIKVKAHVETDGEDDIEGNLLLPLGDGLQPARQRARYIFVVYRADGLTGSIGSREPKDITPFVQISFAGMKGSTSEQIQDCEPRFNEKIIFKEMFPPLFHRVRIALKNRTGNCSSNIIAIYTLNLRSISHSGDILVLDGRRTENRYSVFLDALLEKDPTFSITFHLP